MESLVFDSRIWEARKTPLGCSRCNVRAAEFRSVVGPDDSNTGFEAPVCRSSAADPRGMEWVLQERIDQ